MVKICCGGSNTDGKPRLRINIPRKLVREHNLEQGDQVEISITKVSKFIPTTEISEPLPVTEPLKEEVRKEINPTPTEIILTEREKVLFDQIKQSAERENKYQFISLVNRAKAEFGDERTQLILKKAGLLEN